MKIFELQLADVVRRSDDSHPFNTMTVKQIEKDWITFYRPFVHTADFSHTGGVLCYVGIEEFKVSMQSDHIEYDLLDRKPLK